MAKKKYENVLKDFEKVLLGFQKEHFVFHLYIAGASKKSSEAVRNIKNFCEKYLKDHYKLEVIDIYQQPEFTRKNQVLVAPTLIKQMPPPLKKFIGDMSDINKILVGIPLKLLSGEASKQETNKDKTGRRKPLNSKEKEPEE